MLKAYHSRDENDPKQVLTIDSGSSDSVMISNTSEQNNDVQSKEEFHGQVRLQNSQILGDLNAKLAHLSPDESCDVEALIKGYGNLFPDVPSRTDVIEHDVDVGDSSPIKQNPYRMNPFKHEAMRNEIAYMLENNIIERSSSPWSSPCLLVPKSDGSYRFCTDFRKVNAVTKTDSYPIPRVDDCIDQVGNAVYVTKFDLLKGYWQVPLTERAKEISAFVTPDGFFQYTVMPFGMKNSAATFQRLVNSVVSGLDGCAAYIDDIVVYSESWSEHVERIRALFERLSLANLTINLAKSAFGKATVTFLGYEVGNGKVCPVTVKVDSILNFPRPHDRKQLMRYLGMIGYYRKFCRNFSSVAAPLTNLLKKNVAFAWTDECQQSFDALKAILSDDPVLVAPKFTEPFSIQVDASDFAVGAVLLQTGVDSMYHPVCYFSKKFDVHQRNYSTVEKEALALIMALNHFDVYISNSPYTVVVYTDHNPLVFISRMKNKNQRLLRWSLLLQNYNLDIRHIRGKHNVVADALSRV